MNAYSYAPGILATALPLITNLAYEHWLASDHVELEVFLELGMVTLQRALEVEQIAVAEAFYAALVIELKRVMGDLAKRQAGGRMSKKAS